jgi:hypothetical protein
VTDLVVRSGTVVTAEQADFVAIGWAHIADLHSSGKQKRAISTGFVTASECSRAAVTWFSKLSPDAGLRDGCHLYVNAVAGNEWETETEPAAEPKQVTVVGNG